VISNCYNYLKIKLKIEGRDLLRRASIHRVAAAHEFGTPASPSWAQPIHDSVLVEIPGRRLTSPEPSSRCRQSPEPSLVESVAEDKGRSRFASRWESIGSPVLARERAIQKMTRAAETIPTTRTIPTSAININSRTPSVEIILVNHPSARPMTVPSFSQHESYCRSTAPETSKCNRTLLAVLP